MHSTRSEGSFDRAFRAKDVSRERERGRQQTRLVSTALSSVSMAPLSVSAHILWYTARYLDQFIYCPVIKGHLLVSRLH